jgi:competence protein ComEC
MLPAHKGEIPVAILLVPFIAGIFTGYSLFPGVNTIVLIVVFSGISLVFIALNIAYKPLNIFKLRWVGGVIIHFILFLFGWILAARHDEQHAGDYFSKITAKHLLTRIDEEPKLKNGLCRFTATVIAAGDSNTWANTSGKLMVTVKDTAAKKLTYGNELLIPAKYTAVKQPFNPAEFNYKKYLANQDIFYQQFLYPHEYLTVDSGTGNPVIYWSLRMRQQLAAKLKRNMKDTAAIGVASTLLLGYKPDLSEDIRQVYEKTGTLYVLTVSGAQVAIIYLLLSLALDFLRPYRYCKLLRAVIIIAIIWYYALLTGFSVPVCRAVLMVSLVVIGKTFSRYINSLNLLAVAAFALLIYNPFSLVEPGFQLSFIAVAGLIIFQPVIYDLLNVKNKWLDKLWAVCSVSIAAQLILLPLCAFYFHQLPVYFLASNLFVAIPSTIIMILGFIFLALPQTPFISPLLAAVIEKTTILMNKGLALIQGWPVISINKIWITVPECLLMMAIIFGVLFFLHSRNRAVLKFSLVCLLLLSLSWTVKHIGQSGVQNVAWLNLGKHVGIVFKNGRQAVILSDLKDTDKNYQYSIQPYLDSCEITHAKTYSPGDDISSDWLKKKSGMIQFMNISIFISTGLISDNLFSPRPVLNYLYLTGNPPIALDAFSSNFKYSGIVIDGSNSDASIKKWQAEMPKNIFFKILKRNNSFVSVSN